MTPLLGLLALVVASPQDAPVAIAKADLPAKALCIVCSAKGSGEGEEKAAAGVRYKGKAYFFCNGKEVAEFRADPDGFLPLEIPGPAPKASLLKLDGTATTLEKAAEGKWVLLDFWATWCKPCVDAMPGLGKLQTELKDKNFSVIGVSIDEEGAKKVKPFLAKRPASYPILLDSPTSPAWEAFRVKGVPAMFLLDPSGKIVKAWGGKIDEHKMAEEVRALVSG